MKYRPIDCLFFNVATTRGNFEFPVFGLARCHVTGELIAITKSIPFGIVCSGEIFYPVLWRNGRIISDKNGEYESPREASEAALRTIGFLQISGYDIQRYWAMHETINPPINAPLRTEWFVVPEQIAAFGWRGHVINRYRELAAAHKRLEIRTPWGEVIPVISEAHALAELENIELVARLVARQFDKNSDEYPKIDTVAMLAPWPGTKKEHSEAIGQHICGLHEHMGKMRKALGVVTAVPRSGGCGECGGV